MNCDICGILSRIYMETKKLFWISRVIQPACNYAYGVLSCWHHLFSWIWNSRYNRFQPFFTCGLFSRIWQHSKVVYPLWYSMPISVFQLCLTRDAHRLVPTVHILFLFAIFIDLHRLVGVFCTSLTLYFNSVMRAYSYTLVLLYWYFSDICWDVSFSVNRIKTKSP